MNDIKIKPANIEFLSVDSDLKYKRFYGAAALLGTDHWALSGDRVVDIRDPAATDNGPLHA